MADKIIDTTGIPSVEMEVKPIEKSGRGWFNIFIFFVGMLGCLINFSVIKSFLLQFAWAPGFLLMNTGLTNWLLLRESKRNVISKNVLFIPKEEPKP